MSTSSAPGAPENPAAASFYWQGRRFFDVHPVPGGLDRDQEPEYASPCTELAEELALDVLQSIANGQAISAAHMGDLQSAIQGCASAYTLCVTHRPAYAEPMPSLCSKACLRVCDQQHR